jgi:hypothetical protein
MKVDNKEQQSHHLNLNTLNILKRHAFIDAIVHFVVRNDQVCY